MNSTVLKFLMIWLLAATAHAASSAHDHSAIAGAHKTPENLGEVNFEVNCKAEVRRPFDRAMALLHSFEYDAARNAFEQVARGDPRCAMAHWGIAMSYVHPLWAPPGAEEFAAGKAAASKGQKMGSTSRKERGLIEAAQSYYSTSSAEHPVRMLAYTQAMEELHDELPKDVEVASLYGLALIATAPPDDRTYENQLKAGKLMGSFVALAPRHPGLTHYIIHGYDNFDLAHLALDAARKYSVIAPDSAHALHMPSHIFERLGMWRDSIAMNQRSTQAARNYAASAGIQGHWDEELHGLDFMLTAYLQVGDYKAALATREYVDSIDQVYPQNFKVAYVFAAAPARYALERKDWVQAASLPLGHPGFPWQAFPWERAINTFAVGYGKARLADTEGARASFGELGKLAEELEAQNLLYRALRVRINAQILDAWIKLAENSTGGALAAMQAAVQHEAAMLIPDGPIIPAAEILGDMQLALGNYAKAIEAYASLRQKRRRGAITGALQAATELHDASRITHYRALLEDISSGTSSWPAFAQ